MAEEKKHIDDLFREGLSGHKAKPPPEVWDRVSNHLAAKKRARIIPFVMKLAAGLAILLGLGGSLLHFIMQDTPEDNYLSPENVVIIPVPENGIIHSPDQSLLSKPLADLPAAGNGPGNGIASPGYMAEKETIRKASREDHIHEYSLHEASDKFPAYISSLKPSSLVNDIPDRIVPANLPQSYMSIPERHEESLAVSFPEHKKRWHAGVMMAPNYSYRTLSAASSGKMEEAVYTRDERGLLSYTGRLVLSYIINDRLSVQSGLDFVNIGQSTGGVRIFHSQPYREMLRSGYIQANLPENQPSFNNSLGQINTAGSNVVISGKSHTPPDNNIALHSVSGEITNIYDKERIVQQLFFIQAPIVLRYHLLNGNTGLTVSGGLGANVLAGNRVLLERHGEAVNIGETIGISTFNVAGILGIGLEKHLGNSMILAFEPRFSHFLKSVNPSLDHRHLPYSLSVYGGIFYRF